MSTLSTANIQSKAANTPPVIKDVNGTECGAFAKAFVNWGTASNVVTIRDSLNVASVTETSTGNHTVTFTNAFPNTNYVVVLGSNGNEFYHGNLGKSTTSIETGIANSSGTSINANQQSVVVFAS